MDLATRAIHHPARRIDGAIVPPIQLSTTFEHGPANESLCDHEYIRDGNPNVDDLQTRLASIENAAGSVVFSSGMAAGVAVLQSLDPGSRILFHDGIYFDFADLAENKLSHWGLEVERVDFSDQEAFQTAIDRKPSLVWFESPTNPLLTVLDIEAISKAAHSVGAKVLVDSTFAPPAIQRPLDSGADFVLHSLTKYMGGHSDIQGGSISFAKQAECFESLVHIRRLTGGVLSPFNAWMVSRGIQTLDCRMERHCANAYAIASMLDTHPKIDRVRYPFLESDPGYGIAKKQMSAGGGMISVDVRGGRKAAIDVASKVKLFRNATSLGGVESLIEHRASVEGPDSQTPASLLRMSIGLESATDLIADLEQALG
jgi:cystathionine gamma-synthase